MTPHWQLGENQKFVFSHPQVVRFLDVMSILVIFCLCNPSFSERKGIGTTAVFGDECCKSHSRFLRGKSATSRMTRSQKTYLQCLTEQLLHSKRGDAEYTNERFFVLPDICSLKVMDLWIAIGFTRKISIGVYPCASVAILQFECKGIP